MQSEIFKKAKQLIEELDSVMTNTTECRDSPNYIRAIDYCFLLVDIQKSLRIFEEHLGDFENIIKIELEGELAEYEDYEHRRVDAYIDKEQAEKIGLEDGVLYDVEELNDYSYELAILKQGRCFCSLDYFLNDMDSVIVWD